MGWTCMEKPKFATTGNSGTESNWINIWENEVKQDVEALGDEPNRKFLAMDRISWKIDSETGFS